jgi:hypothetical protein
MRVGVTALAFAVALLVTGLELITGKYPRTASFALKSGWFPAYIIIYGVIAAVVVLILPLVTDQVTMTGIGLGNPWVQAAVIGFAIKAFLHIRLFTVNVGAGPAFPIGIETIVLLFEPWMLRNLDLDVWNKLQAFVQRRASKVATVVDARNTALANIPGGTEPALRAAFNADVGAVGTQAEVIIVYMQYFGTAATGRVFPE